VSLMPSACAWARVIGVASSAGSGCAEDMPQASGAASPPGRALRPLWMQSAEPVPGVRSDKPRRKVIFRSGGGMLDIAQQRAP
jgi:hypothetical protein